MDQVASNSSTKLIESYRDLRVWQTAVDLAVICYEETRTFPASELYGLTSQIRRSASSVAANIAEGYGRDHIGSYVQFLRIAQGSLKELETHFIIAARVGCVGASRQQHVLQRSDEVGKLLRSLIRSLQRSA